MARDFAQVLGEMAYGRTQEELTEKLGELVERVQETNKSGTLTLTIKVGMSGENTVELSDSVKTKLPEFSRPRSLFFVEGEGGLTRQDPRQRSFGLRDVEPHKNAQEA